MEIPFSVVKRTGKAMTSVSKAIFDPMAFPKDRIGLPSNAEVIPTTVSGKEVATAMIKKLMV